MKEETREELLKKIQKLEEQLKQARADVLHYIRVQDVMVAAGVVPKIKVEQAHEIVRNFQS